MRVKFKNIQNVDANLDEFVELGDILALGVAVEQKRRVILGGHLSLVQCLQVSSEVVNALRVQKLVPFTCMHTQSHPHI